MAEIKRPEALAASSDRVGIDMQSSVDPTRNPSHSRSHDPIAVIKKNKLEEIRIELGQFSGHELINVRVWADPRNGGAKRVPTRSGVACNVRLLPELIEALRQAEIEARERGLL